MSLLWTVAVRDEHFLSQVTMHPGRNGYMEAHHPEHGTVGEIFWSPHDGELGGIEVHPDHQRKGLGQHMWDQAHAHAKEQGFHQPTHSPVRTDAGDHWARAVGGHLPERDPDSEDSEYEPSDLFGRTARRRRVTVR
jgi:GNAT superfamily N-acetyltransferase